MPDSSQPLLRGMFRAAAEARLTGREGGIHQTVVDYLASYGRGDIEGRLALFAPDATFEDPVGGPAVVGHDALREFWLAGTAFTIDMDLELLTINGNEAAYVFTANVAAPGSGMARIHTIETIEVDHAGLIRRMRAYFDKDSIV